MNKTNSVSIHRQSFDQPGFINFGLAARADYDKLRTDASSARSVMSDLYRSAIGARLSRLPQLPPISRSEGDEDEDDEGTDSIGSLPGSGMGPPAMQAHSLSLIGHCSQIPQGQS